MTVTEADGVVAVRVRDDGQGFDPAEDARGYGLVGMRERVESLGGALAIESAPGAGTTVTVRLPVGAAGRSGGGRGPAIAGTPDSRSGRLVEPDVARGARRADERVEPRVIAHADDDDRGPLGLEREHREPARARRGRAAGGRRASRRADSSRSWRIAAGRSAATPTGSQPRLGLEQATTATTSSAAVRCYEHLGDGAGPSIAIRIGRIAVSGPSVHPAPVRWANY